MEFCGVWMAYQVMTLSAIGEAETPAGGSVCMRLKSRIRRLLAAVDMLRGNVRVVGCGWCDVVWWWLRMVEVGFLRSGSRFAVVCEWMSISVREWDGCEQ
jgi:hypothetical protein